MDCINILIDYFNLFKTCETNSSNNTSELKKIDSILNNLNNVKEKNDKIQYITDFNDIIEIVKKYDLTNEIANNYSQYETIIYIKDIKSNVEKGIDYVLYDIIFNIIKFNNYLANKKIKTQDLSLNTDISFENLDVNLKDILNYLEIKDGDLDSNLIDDLSNYADINKIREFSIAVKTDNGLRRVLFDKIEDKNVLISILLHSNLEIVDSVIGVFEQEKSNLNKVINNIPSIFIKDLVNSKCKYNIVLTNYNNFISNYKLIKDSGLDFKKMLNQCVFFINDVDKNINIMDKLDSAVN